MSSSVKSKYSRVFRLIAYSIPVLVFVLLELLLRLLGIGASYPLVLSDENNPNYLYINPKLSLRYFDSEEFATQTQFDVFLKNKTDNTFRIIVLGESTAAGFPFTHGASFPRILEHRLQMRYPNKNIEVINTSLAATNTYTLLDISDEILTLNPDVIIISAGHNEYYGALGVGSSQMLSQTQGIVRIYLALKKIRIVQLLRKGIIKVRQSGIKRKKSEASTLMQQMVGNKSIPLNSPLYKAGVNQFRENLERLVKRFSARGVPVVLTNLVSNYKDQPPFTSEAFADTKTPQVLQEAMRLIKTGSNSEAFQIMDRVKTDSVNAQVQYTYGLIALAAKDSVGARIWFARAKDLDLLRFRAPEEFNTIIQDMAQHDQVTLVDMVRAFEQRCDNGIIGKELITEHVHPNLYGYSVMADELFRVVNDQYIPDSRQEPSILEQESPAALVTEVDSVYGELLLLRLFSTWPFKPVTPERDSLEHYFIPSTLPEELAFNRYLEKMQWVEAVNRLHDANAKEGPEKALIPAMALAQEYNHFYEPILMAAKAAEFSGRLNLALFYYTRAVELKEAPEAIVGMARIQVGLNRLEEARRSIEDLQKKSPSQMTSFLLQAITALPELIKQYEENPDNVKAMEDLASSLIILGQREKGIKILEEILKRDPNHTVAQNLMRNINKGQ